MSAKRSSASSPSLSRRSLAPRQTILDTDPLGPNVREIFERFDQSGDGVFDRDELAKLLKTLLTDFDNRQVGALVSEIDKGGDGKVSAKEFLLWLKEGGEGTEAVTRSLLKQTGEARDARIREVFAKYDSEGDGSLSIAELDKTLKMLGAFTNDECRKICADLDKSGDGEVDFDEFAAWIKSANGAREILKAKAILAPSDSDGLEGIFYSFCGAGKSDMDGKGFLKLMKEAKLVDKLLPPASVDLLFADTRVKPKGTRTIDFDLFENALEVVAEKKSMKREEVRAAVLYASSTPAPSPTAKAKLKSGMKKVLMMQKMKKLVKKKPETPKIPDWQRNVDNSELWRTFGLEGKAGRSLKYLYAPPYMPEVPDMNASTAVGLHGNSSMLASGKSASLSLSKLQKSASLPQLSDRSSPRGVRLVYSGKVTISRMGTEASFTF